MKNDCINPIAAWLIAVGSCLLGWRKNRYEAKIGWHTGDTSRIHGTGSEHNPPLRRDRKADCKARLRALKAERDALRAQMGLDKRFSGQDDDVRGIETT